MPKIILCQGSDKTTWAKQWVLEDPEHRVRFNNDDIRNMLGKYCVPSREPLILTLKAQFIKTSMMMGYDIVIDNINLNPKEVEFYKYYVEIHNQTVEELRKENKLNPQDDFKYELKLKEFLDKDSEYFEDIDYSNCNLKGAVEEQIVLSQEAWDYIAPKSKKETQAIFDLKG